MEKLNGVNNCEKSIDNDSGAVIFDTVPAPDNHPQLDKSISNTVVFWERRTGVKLSSEQAREMMNTVHGLFTLLAQWELAKKNGREL